MSSDGNICASYNTCINVIESLKNQWIHVLDYLQGITGPSHRHRCKLTEYKRSLRPQTLLHVHAVICIVCLQCSSDTHTLQKTPTQQIIIASDKTEPNTTKHTCLFCYTLWWWWSTTIQTFVSSYYMTNYSDKHPS
jgi:hypothetical protein